VRGVTPSRTADANARAGLTLTDVAFGITREASRSWPTPNARDYKGAPGAGSRERGGHQSSLPGAMKDFEGSGSLNPTWVEWLLGFPLGWTDCAASEMQSCPKSPSSSAGESSKPKDCPACRMSPCMCEWVPNDD
jgi:hypothetical protein